MSANIAESSSVHVAYWAMAWDLANQVDLSTKSNAETVTIRLNIAIKVHDAVVNQQPVNLEEIQGIIHKIS